jgi:hypothetical protein
MGCSLRVQVEGTHTEDLQRPMVTFLREQHGHVPPGAGPVVKPPADRADHVRGAGGDHIESIGDRAIVSAAFLEGTHRIPSRVVDDRADPA